MQRRAEMMPERFDVLVEQEDERIVLRPRGDLDLATVPEVESRLREARRTSTCVELDLAGLTFIDSTGVRLLLRCASSAESDGWELRLRPGGPAVTEVLEMTGVIPHLPFASSP